MSVRGTILLLVAIGLGAGGCSRAQDGTVLYANPLNRMLGTEESEKPAAPAAFPKAPLPVRSSKPVSGRSLGWWHVRPVRPPITSDPAAAGVLSCRHVATTGGRVRVVCE
jgi:hypothetical protein